MSNAATFGRRSTGELERSVLTVLWDASRPLVPAEVRKHLDPPVAYTTVATILTRLFAKGLVEREPAGRGYAYQAVFSSADLAAQKMHEILSASGNPSAALSRFAATLNSKEAQALRRAMPGRGR